MVRPTASTLEIIQQTWAEILGVTSVGANDDFFELGGNSLIVASAVNQLGTRVGIDLPLRALFEAPTPAEMEELIEELRPETDPLHANGITLFYPEWVVPLQTQGRGRPVFVFPGGLGGYWTLVRDAQVATLVGRERPFFGFRRDETLRNGDRDAWIPIAAAEYARQIEAIQGPGPYLLYAICNGGVLAWETAARLLDRGETIAGILFYEVAFRAAIPEQSPRPAGPEMVRAMPRYEPPSLPVDLTLLMTEGWQSRGRSDGWRDVVQHDLETVVMPGDTPGAHNLYVGREALVAEQVRNWVARSEARLRAR